MKRSHADQAREAAQRGDKVRARRLLRDQLMHNRRDEEAWWLLAQVVEERERTVYCLERVVKLNPQRKAAIKALSLLKRPQRETQSPVSRAADYQSTQRSMPLGKMPFGQAQELRPYRRSLNWPLILGWILVVLISFVAIAGPSLAPRDPLETSLVLKVGEKYLTPPYPLSTPGYPIGSDELGRDLLSRLLWGVKPTITMVIVVAVVRLLLGTMIGLAAGWFTGWSGRFLDTAIAAALSIPIIIVALAGIAAVGVELGIWAFIVGLCMTGWVETSRLVRDQTQIVRDQIFIEAARALGSTSIQILRDHVLPQILPMLWMLFAFEISNTLMLTAALGFLGYYIGGDVWIQITDAAAAAISGMPELGQMLATVGVSPTHPWGLVILGGVVFTIVLSFTLLGEGFRRQLSLHGQRRRSPASVLLDRARLWANEHIWWPLSNLPGSSIYQPAMLLLFIIALISGFVLWRSGLSLRIGEEPIASAFAQEQLWATARHDPHGTRWSQSSGLLSPDLKWTFRDRSGFTGGVAVTQDGIVLVTSNSGVLYAIDHAGKPLWQVLLPETPVGTPAISETGEIYVSDKSGGLSKLSTHGNLLWHIERNTAKAATTGPVVSPNGSIYYVVQREVEAVSPEGKPLWSVQPPGNIPPTEIVQISPDGKFLIWGSVLLDAGDGSVIQFDVLSKADALLVGADGETYVVEGHKVINWMLTQTGARTERSVTWDYQNFTISRTPQDVGVTPNGIIWLFYTGFARSFGFGEDTRVVWLDEDGSLLGNVHYGTRNSKVIAVDRKGAIYSCGNLGFGYGDPECQAFSRESEEPLWQLKLEQGDEVLGGALVPGRLYVATRDGFLYAVGEGEPPSLATAGQAEGPQRTGPSGTLLDLVQEPIGPSEPVSQLFFQDRAGFSGGPAVGQDGVLYLASGGGSLYALEPSGDIGWQAKLPASAVGGPVLNQAGTVFVADQEGGLSAYSKEGELLWQVEPQSGLKGIAGPAVGPGGNIYYTVGTSSRGSIRAVSPEGEPLWLAEVKSELFYASPEASPEGDMVFFRNEVYDAEDGSRLEFNLEFDVDRYFSGNDGRTYLLAGGTVVEWHQTEQGIEVVEERVLSPEGRPINVGVTEKGLVWLLYAKGVFWYARHGEALGTVLLNDTYLTHVVGVDRDFTVYACGRRPQRLFEGKPTCFALSPGSVGPSWAVKLGDQPEKFNGGALVPGRVYISTEEGRLYLIGKK